MDAVIERDADTLLVFDTRSGSLFELNETGRHVWHMFDGRNSLNSIAASLSNGSQQDIRRLESNVREFAMRLSNLGLVQLNHQKRSGKGSPRKTALSKSLDFSQAPNVRKVWSDRTATSGFLVEI
jgi:hypothetical protein